MQARTQNGKSEKLGLTLLARGYANFLEHEFKKHNPQTILRLSLDYFLDYPQTTRDGINKRKYRLLAMCR